MSDQPTYVYRCFDADDRLLYIGCSSCPPLRLRSHMDTAWWWPQVAKVRNLVFPGRSIALEQERQAIYHEKPRCNVKGRWYKHDPRETWDARDYSEYHHSVLMAAAVIGPHTERLLARVENEAMDRFGVSLLRARRSA